MQWVAGHKYEAYGDNLMLSLIFNLLQYPKLLDYEYMKNKNWILYG